MEQLAWPFLRRVRICRSKIGGTLYPLHLVSETSRYIRNLRIEHEVGDKADDDGFLTLSRHNLIVLLALLASNGGAPLAKVIWPARGRPGLFDLMGRLFYNFSGTLARSEHARWCDGVGAISESDSDF